MLLVRMSVVPQDKATRSLDLLIRLLILALALGLLAGVETWRSYRQATSTAERFAAGFTKVLARQTEEIFKAIDLALVGIRDALQAAPATAPNDPGFRAALIERLKSLPYLRAVFVIGADGFITHDTAYPETPRINLEDRAYFRAHRDDPGLDLHIGKPLRSRSVGVWFVSFSRRITNPDGSFGGAVVAAVEPRYFKRFYKGLSINESHVISLALRDGTLLARIPKFEETIGTKHVDSPVRKLALEHGSATAWATSPVDNITRLVGYHTLAGGSALVIAGWSSASILDAWHGHAAAVGLGCILIWLLTTVLAVVSHQHRRRAQLEHARLAQSRRLELMGRIVGGIAHDLGNTVKIARTTFTLLKPSLAAQHDAMALVEDADRSLKSAFEIIDRLLAFARRQELSPRPTDLADLIEGFSPILRQAAGHIELVLDLAKPLVCSIDPIHLESALLNLVLNSKDAIADSGRIVIELREVQAPHRRRSRRGATDAARLPWAEIAVKDDGVGMPREVLDRAFEPFFTTRTNGSGLGLSQVLGFVKQSSGDVSIDSWEGRGTVVRLLFPTTSEPVPGPTKPPEHPV